MSVASPPTRRIARVCDACGTWPCLCERETTLPVYVEPTFRVERCVCGGHITVYETTAVNILAAVHEHNTTPGHALWRRGRAS